MNAKHTPGPWRITEYQPNKRTNRTVSLIWGQQISPLAEIENGPRAANARLIAAAPELLEACKAVLSAYGPIQGDSVWNALKAILETAIAKAEGHQ